MKACDSNHLGYYIEGADVATRILCQFVQHRYEIKCLEQETKKYIAKLDTQKYAIDKQFEYEKKKLEEKRKIIESAIKRDSEKISQHHVRIQDINKSIATLATTIADPKVPPEQKDVMRRTIVDLSKMVAECTSQETIYLSKIVENTNNILAGIPQATKLIEYSGGA
jgi:hypothetical protein